MIPIEPYIQRYGQDVILRRSAGTSAQQFSDATVRAAVRGYEPHEIAGTIQQGDSRVVMSAAGIDAVQWPGGMPVGSPPSALDPRIPRAGDRIVINGRSRNVIMVAPIYVGDALVRIDLQVRG